MNSTKPDRPGLGAAISGAVQVCIAVGGAGFLYVAGTAFFRAATLIGRNGRKSAYLDDLLLGILGGPLGAVLLFTRMKAIGAAAVTGSSSRDEELTPSHR